MEKSEVTSADILDKNGNKSFLLFIKMLFSKLFRNKGSRPNRWLLNDAEICEKLCSNNIDVISELFSIVKALRIEEINRLNTLDSKAASLFGLLGVLGSVALLAISIKEDNAFYMIANSSVGKLALVSALFCMALSLFFLYSVIRVRSAFTAPGDTDLFGGVHNFDEADSERDGAIDAHRYKRFLTEHFWKLYTVISDQNEEKAKHLIRAQGWLFFAILIIVALQIYTVISLPNMTKSSSPQNPTLSTQATTARPAPIAPSSSGIKISNGNANRPTALPKSSAGQSRGLGYEMCKSSEGNK